MASIRKRGKRWQAQVRKKGSQTVSKSFARKADALAWTQIIESELERGIFIDRSIAEQTTLSTAFDRYIEEVVPTLRSAASVLSRFDRLQQHFGSIFLAQINSSHLACYRNERLKLVGPQSVKHELGILNRILKQAHLEWGIVLPHGVPTVLKPKLPPGRTRRLEPGEERRLLAALTHTPEVQLIVRIALETAMRRSEVLRIKPSYIKHDKNLLSIPFTKTNIPRTIPLTPAALNILRRINRRTDSPIFPIKPDSVTQAFSRACVRAGITDLRLHDLRHEATSRFFERGLTIMEVAAITGHKDLPMLQRYTHLKPEDILKKLA